LKIKKIYIVRHGQTDYNKRGIVQGSGVDAPLNEEGLRQAAAFFEYYKDVPFQKVYASGLQRSQQSIRRFIDLGLPYQFLPELNEIHWGSKEGMPFTEEENRYYHQMLESWRQGHTEHAIDGGESPEEVRIRLARAMELILKGEEELILICMHGRAMRVLLCHLLNYPLSSMDEFLHENLSLYKLCYTGSMFSLEAYNDRRHLGL
jgi:broad specificity phosphatase PhoE